MLRDIPPRTLREAGRCILQTERLALRRPTLADVNAIARLADDRRIAENSRRLPHPYSQGDAVEFVRGIPASRETVFLVAGADKKAVLREVLDGDQAQPAARLQPQGTLRFLADRAAA